MYQQNHCLTEMHGLTINQDIMYCLSECVLHLSSGLPKKLQLQYKIPLLCLWSPLHRNLHQPQPLPLEKSNESRESNLSRVVYRHEEVLGY